MDPIIGLVNYEYSPSDHIDDIAALLRCLSANDPTFSTEIHLAEEPGVSTLPPSLDINDLLQGLCSALQNNTYVTKLVIRDLPQAIEDSGVYALYSLLRHNPYITDLVIENVKFESLLGLRQVFLGIACNPHSAMRNLVIASADAIQYEEEDDDMHCDPTAVFWTDAEGLAELLRTTTTLRRIDLSPNGLHDVVATRVLAPALAQNSTLIELDVSRNDDISEEGLRALRNAMGSRGTVIMDCIDEENAVHVIPCD